MEYNFLQILILILVGLLFGKDNLLPWILKKIGLNGHFNGNGNSNGNIKKQLDLIADNHLHTIEEILNKAIENQSKLASNQERILALLQEIKEYGVKTRN